MSDMIRGPFSEAVQLQYALYLAHRDVSAACTLLQKIKDHSSKTIAEAAQKHLVFLQQKKGDNTIEHEH